MNTTYDIKEFQKNLPSIVADMSRTGASYTVSTSGSGPSMVAVPYEEYQELVELKAEVTSNTLKEDVKQGRREYREGTSRDFSEFLADAT